MKAKIEFVKGAPEHLPILLRFIQGLAKYEEMENQVIATIDVLRDSLFGHETTNANFLLAYDRSSENESDHQAVGFALYFYTFSTFLGKKQLYLEDLYVQEEARQQGIGTAFLAECASIAVAEGCERMDWICLENNHSAQACYTKLGAEILDQWKLNRLSGAALETLAALRK